jgi:hypothetical protein
MGPIEDNRYKVLYPKENWKYQIRKLFKPDLQGLHLALFQLSVLICKFCPALFKHLELLGVSTTLYACQWFLTLFSYSLPLEVVFRLYDMMFIQGVHVTLMRVALALLCRNEGLILRMSEVGDVIQHLKKNVMEVYLWSPDDLITDASKLDKLITRGLLADLEKRY